MTAITANERRDALDIEAYEAMASSSSFAAYRERIEAELVRARAVCENSHDHAEIMRAQGAAHALRVVLGLPARMLEEMKRATWKASV